MLDASVCVPTPTIQFDIKHVINSQYSHLATQGSFYSLLWLLLACYFVNFLCIEYDILGFGNRVSILFFNLFVNWRHQVVN